MKLAITPLHADRVTVLELAGDLDDTTVGHLRTAVLGSILDGRANLLLDFAGVTFVDYPSVAALVDLVRQARARGGDLRLCCASVYARRLLNMCGVAKVIAQHATRQEALDAWRAAA